MKNDREGQAAVLTNAECSKIRNQIKSRKYKLLFDLAWYTGERWGAIVKLRIADVYSEDGTPREYINFRARTRKASPNRKPKTGNHTPKRKNRQVPVHPVLKEILLSYKPESDNTWIFPNRSGDEPISFRWADTILRTAVEKAGLSAKGISTHSTRRTFITNLANKGINLAMIKKITGHTDLKVLSLYIEVSDDDVKQAIRYSMNPNLLFLQIEIFFERLQQGEYDHPLYLAMALENLASQAWDEVDEIYPNLCDKPESNR